MPIKLIKTVEVLNISWYRPGFQSFCFFYINLKSISRDHKDPYPVLTCTEGSLWPRPCEPGARLKIGKIYAPDIQLQTLILESPAKLSLRCRLIGKDKDVIKTTMQLVIFRSSETLSMRHWKVAGALQSRKRTWLNWKKTLRTHSGDCVGFNWLFQFHLPIPVIRTISCHAKYPTYHLYEIAYAFFIVKQLSFFLTETALDTLGQWTIEPYSTECAWNAVWKQRGHLWAPYV